MKNEWTKRTVDGVEVIECEGYELELADVQRQPWFFMNHVAEKMWATSRIIDDLRIWAVTK